MLELQLALKLEHYSVFSAQLKLQLLLPGPILFHLRYRKCVLTTTSTPFSVKFSLFLFSYRTEICLTCSGPVNVIYTFLIRFYFPFIIIDSTLNSQCH